MKTVSILFICLALVLAFSFSGCNKAGKVSTTTDAAASTTPQNPATESTLTITLAPTTSDMTETTTTTDEITTTEGPTDTTLTGSTTTKITTTTTPSLLKVSKPANQSVVDALSTTIKGSTLPGAVVSINGRIVNVDSAGNFSLTVNLDPGPNVFDILATDNLGNQKSFQLIISSVYLSATTP